MVHHSDNDNLLIGDFQLPTNRALIMGVINVTPDSFSGDGFHSSPNDAIAQAHQLVLDGADIIDVGGESTRPGAKPISAEEEMNRVLPIIEIAAQQLEVPLSIDTSKADVAAHCIAAGASMVNDIKGLQDQEMLDVIQGTGIALTLMHMRGTPETMAVQNSYGDLISEIKSYLLAQAEKAIAAGAQTVVIDPGLGFAKDTAQNLMILNNLRSFVDSGYPVLVGPSRKRFIGELTGAKPNNRVPGTIAAVIKCVESGVAIVRVHDVAACKQAIAVNEAINKA